MTPDELDDLIQYRRVDVSDIERYRADGWVVAVPRSFGASVEWVWMKREVVR